VFYDKFNDCHNEIAVAGTDFIGTRQFVAFICKGWGASRALLMRIVTSDHGSNHRW
jgi:hypothetical protein